MIAGSEFPSVEAFLVLTTSRAPAGLECPSCFALVSIRQTYFKYHG